MAAMTSTPYVRQLPASSPTACDIIGLLYALQFLIHSTYFEKCHHLLCVHYNPNILTDFVQANVL